MITDDQLSRRLAREGTRTRVATMPETTAASIVSDVRRSAKSRGVRRRTLAAIAGAAVIGGGLLFAPAATAAVQRFLAQTDFDYRGTEVIEDSEFIDTSASDLGEYTETIYPEWLPLAPGQSRAELIEQVTAQHAASPAITQEVGIRRSFEHAVYTAWIDEWIAGDAADDAQRRDAASAVLADAATWPAFTLTDGGGVTYIMAAYAEQITAGNADAAQELAQVEQAPSWDGVNRDKYYARFLSEYGAGK